MTEQTIAELESTYENRNEETIVTELGTVEIDDLATSLTIAGQSFPLEGEAEGLLASYLKIPKPYLKSLGNEFKATTLRYHLDQNSEADTMLEIVNGHIISIHTPDRALISTRDIVAVAAKVFEPDDIVRTILRDETTFHLDVTSQRHLVEVPNPERVVGRPEVGDITQAGVRILAFPHQVKNPIVESYLCRLVCTNGMTSAIPSGRIELKGNTVDEVLAEMERAAETALSIADERLAQYLATASTQFPGNPQQFAVALATEAGLGAGVIKRVIDILNQIPEETATVYDVVQAFTAVANHDVNHSTMIKLQRLGGHLSTHTADAINRCGTCEQHLPR